MLAVSLMASAPAFSAPTCQNGDGDTVRCGTAGAMPVGWSLPLAERLERQSLKPPLYPSTNLFLELICVLGVFFALLALMPEFEGRREGDWDRQEGDDAEGR